MSTLKGIFKPKNPQKYKGNVANIHYRSSWELKTMMKLDSNPNVISWSSEELVIPYRSPIDNKIHRYFPDFMVEQINKFGKKETLVIEIKPKKETVPPVKPKKMTRRYINEALTYGKNMAKWSAAEEICSIRKWKFVIFTETELFGK